MKYSRKQGGHRREVFLPEKGGTMGKRDVISKIYLGAADRIADLLNNELFEGGSVVCAADIMNLDSTAARTLRNEKDTVHVRIVAQDVVRKVNFGMQRFTFCHLIYKCFIFVRFYTSEIVFFCAFCSNRRTHCLASPSNTFFTFSKVIPVQYF